MYTLKALFLSSGSRDRTEIYSDRKIRMTAFFISSETANLTFCDNGLVEQFSRMKKGMLSNLTYYSSKFALKLVMLQAEDTAL